MRETFSILRIHIVLVAVLGTLTFGWLTTGRYLVWVALIAGLDWMLINLANRVSDVAEDLANQIPGAARVSASKRLFLGAFVVILVGSFALTIHLFPQLTAWRVLIQGTGFFYNFKVIPSQRGRIRLKDRYFFKNFLSAIGFFITCFGFPLAMSAYDPKIGWVGAAFLILYFTPYEMTFEIFYDLRDVEGDRKQNVRTYPVVHGPEVSVKIINALLAVSVAVSCLGFLVGGLGARELLMAGGPVIQFFVIRLLVEKGPTTDHCIGVTHLASGLLALYLIGTAAWLWLGLPANIYL